MEASETQEIVEVNSIFGVRWPQTGPIRVVQGGAPTILIHGGIMGFYI